MQKGEKKESERRAQGERGRGTDPRSKGHTTIVIPFLSTVHHMLSSMVSAPHVLYPNFKLH